MSEESNTPKYPNVTVPLIGQDGNAFMIVGRVSGELKRAGVPKEEVEQYIEEATSGDYDHLLATTMKWVSAE